MNGILEAEIVLHINMIDPSDVERVIDLELACVKRDLLDLYERETGNVADASTV